MKHSPAPIISQHRFARYVVWARLMLAWLARFVFRRARRPTRRYIAQRYGYASLDALARLVRNLILLRAFERARVRRPPPRLPRDFARAGFRRRLRPRQLVRAVAGANLRRALRHRDPVQRIARLLEALAHIDLLAAPLIARIKRGLSRLYALTIAHAVCATPPDRAPCAPPAAADTS